MNNLCKCVSRKTDQPFGCKNLPICKKLNALVLEFTRKKQIKNPLKTMQQGVSILASVLIPPLNQITRLSESSSHFRILPTNWHQRQYLSGTKANIGRLMRDRWWFNCARFIKKAGKSCQINRSRRPTAGYPWNLPGEGTLVPAQGLPTGKGRQLCLEEK